MPPLRSDVCGLRFGRLVVLREAPLAIHPSGKQRRVLVRCDCGNETTVLLKNLRWGNTRSCGCLNIERLRKHGDTVGRRSAEYYAWSALIQRCTNRKIRYYKDYGGRGIKVCQRWRKSYAAFLKDMGRRPSPQHSIDRIDNDGNYTPKNCRWATASEQRRNQRKPKR